MEIPGAQSAYRVLDILTEVSLNPRGSTAGEIARNVEVTPPTAHRLLRCCVIVVSPCRTSPVSTCPARSFGFWPATASTAPRCTKSLIRSWRSCG